MTRVPFPALLACALLPLASARASIIYNNRLPTASGFLTMIEPGESASDVELPGLPAEHEFDRRVGDSITFPVATTDRFCTSFSTRLISFQSPVTPVSMIVELTIYENAAGLPGALLWTGTTPLTLTTTQPVIADFAPSITLPNSVCFAIAVSSVVGTRGFGVVSSSGSVAGAVGTSPNTILWQDTASLAWRTEDLSTLSGGIFRHVDAVVTAVPAPSTLAPLFAALPLAAARRTRSPRPR